MSSTVNMQATRTGDEESNSGLVWYDPPQQQSPSCELDAPMVVHGVFSDSVKGKSLKRDLRLFQNESKKRGEWIGQILS